MGGGDGGVVGVLFVRAAGGQAQQQHQGQEQAYDSFHGKSSFEFCISEGVRRGPFSPSIHTTIEEAKKGREKFKNFSRLFSNSFSGKNYLSPPVSAP